MRADVNRKRTVFIDAMPLAEPHMSGIGHLTFNLVNSLLSNDQFNKDYDLKLVVPFNKVTPVRQKFNKSVSVKPIFLPAVAIELLMRLRILPPMDIFLGKGQYIFPNYKNWPLLKSKSYTYIHDLSFIKYPQFVAPKNQKYLKKYVPMWLKRSDVVLTLSDFSKREIVDTYKIPNSKVEVTYLGIDPIFYRRSHEEVEHIKQKYKIYTDKYYLYVGNIEPRKNLTRLVDAYTMLPDNVKEECSLLIIGADGWLNTEVMLKISQAQAKGFKILMPSKFVEDKDLPAIYSGAVALVQPSLYEGFGMPPIEAMLCSVPTVVAKVGPMPEITNGASLYFNPTDTDSIKTAIFEVVNNKSLRDNLIHTGNKQAVRFTSRVYSSRIVKLLANS